MSRSRRVSLSTTTTFLPRLGHRSLENPPLLLDTLTMAAKENEPVMARKNPFSEPPAKRRKLSPPAGPTQTDEEPSQGIDMDVEQEMPPLSQTQPSQSQGYSSSQGKGPKASQEPKQPTFADVLARLKEETHETQGTRCTT